jgi:hypothetical protein
MVLLFEWGCDHCLGRGSFAAKAAEPEELIYYAYMAGYASYCMWQGPTARPILHGIYQTPCLYKMHGTGWDEVWKVRATKPLQLVKDCWMAAYGVMRLETDGLNIEIKKEGITYLFHSSRDAIVDNFLDHVETIDINKMLIPSIRDPNG